MRHGRRTTLTTSDIDYALRTLNIEPLYGHLPFSQPSYRKALPFPQISTPGTSQPTTGPVYFVEDEEVDFERVLREEKIMLPKGVSWTAHWLAVEGVQPLIPENPPAVPREEPAAALVETKINGTSSAAIGAANLLQGGGQKSSVLPGASSVQSSKVVKQVLSRELQLYYARLTSSLLPSSNTPEYATKKVAALASLRHDAGLQALLPYLVRWLGEGVISVLKTGEQGDGEGKVLEVLMDVVGALLENRTLFVEPYVSHFPIAKFIESFVADPASPTPSSSSFDSSSFHTSLLSINPSPYQRLTNPISSTDPAQYNLSIFITSYHENSFISIDKPRKESWYT